MRRTAYLIPLAVILLVVLLSSIFIVDEREKALVLQFGQIRQVKEDPGLAFKIPVIQQVIRYDDRILSLDTETFEVTPSDDRRLVVDAFARYRISDVVAFRQAVGVGGLRDAENRLERILNSNIREVLGSEGVTSNTILSEDRSGLMTEITERSRAEAEALGLQVVDVRLKQTNLPTQNLEATFARMRAEREREAADERARGEEAAQRVRALADRTVVELVSEARRESEIVRGEADARRNNIFAQAYGGDPEFFEFYRSLTAYQRALQEGNSTLVISPTSEFFDYLQTPQPDGTSAPAPVQGAPAPSGQQDQGGGAGGEELSSEERNRQIQETVDRVNRLADQADEQIDQLIEENAEERANRPLAGGDESSSAGGSGSGEPAAADEGSGNGGETSETEPAQSDGDGGEETSDSGGGSADDAGGVNVVQGGAAQSAPGSGGSTAQQ